MDTFSFWKQVGTRKEIVHWLSLFSSQLHFAPISTQKNCLVGIVFVKTPSILVSQPSCHSGAVYKHAEGLLQWPAQTADETVQDPTSLCLVLSLKLSHSLFSSVPAVIVAFCHLKVGGDGLPQALAHQRVIRLGSLFPENHRPAGDRGVKVIV